MSLFVIGDTHLSLSVNKPMDIFGGWKNYMQRLEENWRAIINKEDTCLLYTSTQGKKIANRKTE